MNIRVVLAVAVASLVLPASLPAPAIGAPTTSVPLSGPVLDTPEQVAAERMTVALLADPEIKAVQRQLETKFLTSPTARAPGAKARLAGDIVEWSASSIMQALAGDPARPAILWMVDDTPHSWHGFDMPGRAASADSPDNIYRGAFIDGAGRYEIDGQVNLAHRPAQFSFEFLGGSPDALGSSHKMQGTPDFGKQIAVLTNRNIVVAADGSFHITIGGPGNGPDHVATPAEPVTINIRDTLSDWTQQPNRLTIRRLDSGRAVAYDQSAIRAKVLADLPGYVSFWANFPQLWYGKLPLNKIIGPMPRQGGWGLLALLHYRLTSDEALVIRTRSEGAGYTGIQVTDPWSVTLDVQKYTDSINSAQAVPDKDGGYTYVVSLRDPGVANWVETGGQQDGEVILRWQAIDPHTDPKKLVRSVQLVQLSELPALPGTPRRNPTERAAILAQRGAQYRLRLGQ